MGKLLNPKKRKGVPKPKVLKELQEKGVEVHLQKEDTLVHYENPYGEIPVVEQPINIEQPIEKKDVHVISSARFYDPFGLGSQGRCKDIWRNGDW
jgi:hypothetical protein